MTVMRLLAFFIFTVLLTGCNKAPSDDQAQAAQDVKAAKAQPPCSPPGQRPFNSCYYRLQITQVLGNAQFKGKVPQDVIDKENSDCRAPGHSADPAQCSKGDKGEHPFTVDGAQPKVGEVVDFDSDPTTGHLKKRP